jgi:hypothetical protein
VSGTGALGHLKEVPLAPLQREPGSEGPGQRQAQEPAEAPEGVEEEAAERPPPVMRRRPNAPTAAEREEHERMHEPYRAWCPACVAGRGRADAHLARHEAEKGIPVIGVDYGYQNEQEGEDEAADDGSNPLLCGRNSRDRMMFCHLLKEKGNSVRNREVLARELEAGGYQRQIVRSDGEPAMVAHVVGAIQQAMLSGAPLEFLREQVSKGQSQGNGLAEGAVKEAKAKIRTLRHAAEHGLGRTIPDNHDVLAWLPTHAAATINVTRVGVDGRTPYELRYGKKFRRPVAPWGQKVHWMPTGKLVSRTAAESRWKEGIFLGLYWRGPNDYAVGTPDGVMAARAIKLMPEEDAWDSELVLAVKGVPWDRMKAEAAERILMPRVAVAVDLPPPPEPAEQRPRRVYIRRDVELRRHGMTDGCPGCLAASQGQKKAEVHTDACRARIEECMRRDAEGAARLEAAGYRADGARAVEGGEPAAGSGSASSAGPARREKAVVDDRQTKRARLEEGLGSQEAAVAPSSGSDAEAPPERMELEAASETRVRTAAQAGLPEVPGEAPMDVSAEVEEIAAVTQDLAAIDADVTDLAELFNPNRFGSVAGAFRLVPGTAFDLRTGWDLATPAGRQRCWEALHEELPELVVGSPPCASFSTLQALRKKQSAEREAALKEGIEHINFCAAVYKWQHARERYFLHEHPWGASSWRLQAMKALRTLKGVELVRMDQCMVGQEAWDRNEDGTWAWRPARKRTGWLTNMPEMAETLGSFQCDGSHRHARLIGGTARATERYPARLVKEILKTLRNVLRRERGTSINAIESGIGPHVDEDVPDPTFEIEEVEYGKIYDIYTGVELDPVMVRGARQEELNFADKLGAWEPRTRAEAFERMSRAPYGSRWLDHNKGDEERKEYRSRLVVQETRRSSTIPIDDIASVTSSTPPLEIVRLFCSLCMTLTGPRGEQLVMQFLDISRAHPHCKVLRDNVYIEAPKEMNLPEGMCLLLKKCWYGTRDAGQAFEFAVRDDFLENSFEQGLYTPCVYRHKEKLLMYFVHGDDYVGVGMRDDLDWYEKQLSKRFIVKNRGTLGPGESDVKQIRILNRVIEWHPASANKPDMITYEADLRHVDLICAAYNFKENTKSKATPWDKPAFMDKNPLAGDPLEGSRATTFRSTCMRNLFLALDRPDLQFVAKEISRVMSKPTVYADETLKGVARYLRGNPRVVWQYPRQPMVSKVVGLTDANWGACPVTRKSTSSTHLMLGRHPIFSASSTQAIIALSSGESEFYGAVKTACRLLGLRSLLSDLKLDMAAELVTDSTSAKGMASRRGAGRVRHIHCPALWLQQAIARRRLTIAKRAGKELSADTGTKAGIPAQHMWELLGRFGVVRAQGRSSVQLEAT